MLCVSHKLEIETGRWKPDTLREERICKLCPLGKVEDEVHFIAECPTYGEIRNQYLGSTTYTNKENLFSERDPASVAAFLRKAYSLRENILDKNSEKYHIAKKEGLKMTIHRGPKTGLVCNVEKDGIRIKLKTVPIR